VNFGLLGIVPLFAFLGILYRIPQLLLERERTTVTLAIFVAVTVAMVPIGSSISNAFGGFLQQIILQGYLLRMFTRERPKKARARAAIDVSPAPWGSPGPARIGTPPQIR
jgi:hypothetical protein